MALIVTFVGVLITLVCLAGLALPARLVALLVAAPTTALFTIAVGTRAAIGVVFLLAADGCRLPWLVRIIGLLALVAAVVLLLAGRGRFTRLMRWWLGGSTRRMRLSCLAGLAVGIVVVLAGG